MLTDKLRTERHPNASEIPNPSEKDLEKEGEELRKQTPCLPDDLLEKLPPVIREAVRYYADVRERDMGVLAACTVLSACLPGVHGSLTVAMADPASLYGRGGSGSQRERLCR